MSTIAVRAVCCYALLSLATSMTTLHVAPPPPGRKTQLYQAPTADGTGAWIITADKPSEHKVQHYVPPVRVPLDPQYNEIEGSSGGKHNYQSSSHSHLPASFVVTSRPFGLGNGGTVGQNARPQQAQRPNFHQQPQHQQKPVYIDLGASEALPQTHPTSASNANSQNTQDKFTSLTRPDGVAEVNGHKLPSYNLGCTSGKKCSFIIPTQTTAQQTAAMETDVSDQYDKEQVNSFLSNYQNLLNNNRTSSYLVQKMQTIRRHPSPMEAYLRDQKRKATFSESLKLRPTTTIDRPGTGDTPLNYAHDTYNKPKRPGMSGYYSSIPYTFQAAARRPFLPWISMKRFQSNRHHQQLQQHLHAALARSGRLLFDSSQSHNDGVGTRFGVERQTAEGHAHSAPPPSTRTITPTGQIFRMRLSSGPITFSDSNTSVEKASEYRRRSKAGAKESSGVKRFVSIETDEGTRELPNALHPKHTTSTTSRNRNPHQRLYSTAELKAKNM